MRERIRAFLNDTDGAVMADYVVFTAAIAVAGMNSVSAVRGGMNSLAGEINASLAQAQVALLCEGLQTCGSGADPSNPIYEAFGLSAPPVTEESTLGSTPAPIPDSQPAPDETTTRTELTTLALTFEEAESFLTAIATYDTGSLYDAMLLHAHSAQAYIDAGQFAYASQYLDYVGLITNTLYGRPDSGEKAQLAQDTYDALLEAYLRA